MDQSCPFIVVVIAARGWVIKANVFLPPALKHEWRSARFYRFPSDLDQTHLSAYATEYFSSLEVPQEALDGVGGPRHVIFRQVGSGVACVLFMRMNDTIALEAQKVRARRAMDLGFIRSATRAFCTTSTNQSHVQFHTLTPLKDQQKA